MNYQRVIKVGTAVAGVYGGLRKFGVEPSSRLGVGVLAFALGNATGIYLGLNIDSEMWKNDPQKALKEMMNTASTPLTTTDK